MNIMDETSEAPVPPADERETRARINAHELAVLLKADLSTDEALARVSFYTRPVRAGDALVRSGDECNALYVIRFGSFKASLFDHTGVEQGLGFPMTGDVVGVDGLASGFYNAEVVALERSEVVVIPYPTELTREYPSLGALFYRMISRELVREQSSLYLLGSLSAEGRVASFLLNLSQRYGDMGYSRSAFMLRMTRQEIATYLGLKLETVSRMLSAFSAEGLINVQGKQIEILDPQRLRGSITEPLNALKKRPKAARAWAVEVFSMADEACLPVAA